MTFPVTSFSKNFYLVPIVFPHFTGFFVFQLLATLGSPVSVVGVLFILSMCSGFLNYTYVQGDSSFTARAKTPTYNLLKILKKFRNDCMSV
jgi:hypothetical protein